MSASVDQRMKGQGNQVSNGPKDSVNDEEFDSWRNQPHQSYSAPMSANSMADPYMSSYYGMFPYQNLGLGEGAWSNGGDPMTFLSGGYNGQMGNEQHSHYMDGMFGGGGFGGFSQPGFNYFHGNGGDYSAWGSSSRKPSSHQYDDYYREMYGGDQSDRSGIKPVEQGMQGLSIVDRSDKVDIKGGAGAAAVNDLVGKSGGPDMGGQMPVNAGPQVAKKMTWATIASQPAKPQPKSKPKSIPPAPMLPGKHGNSMDIGTWESKNGSGGGAIPKPPSNVAPLPARSAWSAPRGRGGGSYSNPPPATANNQVAGQGNFPAHPVLDKLRQVNEYNPKEFDMNPKAARFFIIKSYSEDDIHRSIKYGIWCSTEHGNKRLDTAFREREGKGPLFLLYSVNGSGHFCGMAQMMSELDYNATSNVWAQDKWKGEFKVKWIYVKDVPNSQLRHIRLENNENKPVTNSRDTQEVPPEKGKQVLKIIHSFRHTTSIFDDFVHYEKRQEEEDQRKQDKSPGPGPIPLPVPVPSGRRSQN